MQNQKEDRRIRITKLAIKESLIELMQEYPISKISVTMICDAADINRSTFYTHYTDPYDLLNQIQREVIDGIKEHVFSILFMEQAENAITVITKVLEYVKANAPLFKALLGGNGDVSFQDELMYLVQDKMIQEIREDRRLEPRVTKYVEIYAVSSARSILYKWLSDGCLDETGRMAEIIITLLTRGVNGLYQ